MDASKMQALEGFVQEVDGESPAALAEVAEQQKAEAQAVTEAQAWAAVPMAVGKLVCMIAPELEPIYSPENCQQWGESMVPVAEKYGWNGPSKLPELGLLIATGTFAVPSYLVVKEKLKALKKLKADREAAEQAGRGPGSVVDTSGVPVGEGGGDGG